MAQSLFWTFGFRTEFNPKETSGGWQYRGKGGPISHPASSYHWELQFRDNQTTQRLTDRAIRPSTLGADGPTFFSNRTPARASGVFTLFSSATRWDPGNCATQKSATCRANAVDVCRRQRGLGGAQLLSGRRPKLSTAARCWDSGKNRLCRLDALRLPYFPLYSPSMSFDLVPQDVMPWNRHAQRSLWGRELANQV